MKPIHLAIVLLGISSPVLFADGFPFDQDTQRVTCETLRLKLSKEQVDQLSAAGLVTFNEAQLSLIRRFYPNTRAVQSVISATFNDNHEGLTHEDVYLFWVAADEVAVTLNARVIGSEALRGSALAGEAEAQPGDIRISPNGVIYIAGTRSSMKDALRLIADRAKQPDKLQIPVSVCVAPPFHAPLSQHKDADGQYQVAGVLEKSVADIYQVLAEYGKAREVAVNKCW